MFSLPLLTQAAYPFSLMIPARPAPKTTRQRLGGFEELAVDGLRRVLSAICRSFTALGNRANALFAQIAAALALDRALRATAEAFGPASTVALWPARPRLDPFSWVTAWARPFAAPLLFTNPWLAIPFKHPWAAFAGTFDAYSRPFAAPQKVTFAVPGFAFGIAWDPMTFFS